MRPDEAVYNIVHAYRIRGPLDCGRLRSAFLAAIARHEPLTTSFGPGRIPLDPEVATDIVEIEADAERFEQLAQAEARRRFDLDAGPLVRIILVHLGDDDHGLVLALHHVSSDAASLANLWSDVDHAYREHGLPEPVRTYSDHAEWQASRIGAADREFWTDHLGSDPHAVVLPLASPGPDEPDGYLTRPLPIEASRLREAGHRPMPFLLATFAALLQRYTDEDAVIVGVIASTRDHPVVEPLVGYFLTVLPLRLDVDPRSTPAQVARSTDETLAEALTHRHVPYAEITAGLRRRGVAQPDPARVMFVLDEPHRPELSGCTVDGHLVHPGASVTDLTVFVRPGEEAYELSLEWSGRVYRRTDVEALADEYARMLEWGVDHPERPWSDLPIEGAPVDMVGAALTREPRPLPVLIDDHATDRPSAPAVRCGGDHLTYDELATQAAAVAEALAARGVVAGDRVGVLLPRSVDLVTTILAVQRLGAAYVPIDVSYPDQRVDLLLRLGAPRLTVTDEVGARRLDGPVVTWAELAGRSSPEPKRGAVSAAVDLDDPAYVIFTSGSTGRPRGVLVDQRRLAASTLARLDHYADTSGRPSPVDRFLMVSSVGFDSSVAGIYWTLVSGGELILPTEHEVHDVDALAAVISEAAVTHTLMVPTLYRALLERKPAALQSLRTVVVAGETCPASLVELHHRYLPGTELWNEYGPTETTVWATAHRCRPGDDPVPIGLPVPGAMTRVADRWLRPRPPGAAGELAIGGAGVTDGYVDDPQLSAAAFTEDPATGERWYRSGDLARIDDAGRLVFLGRRDQQISLGGMRVEPEEIEVALTACNGVRAAVVRIERRLLDDPLDALAALPSGRVAQILQAAAAAKDPANELAIQLAHHVPGPDVLVAYVEGDELDTAELESRLREAFPPALVPAIEPTDLLPRTEHGKIDRSALPPPLRRLPQTRSEREPAGLLPDLVDGWNLVLGTTDLGPDSDFFGNGGNSLLAIELVTRLETGLGRQVPISSLVLGRTPRRLAELISSTGEVLPAPSPVRRSYVVPLRPEGELAPLVIAPTAGGNLIRFDPFVQLFDRRFPIIGLELPGADRDEDLPRSIDDLCDIYVPQLREVLPHGPYRFLGWSFGGVVALELARRLRDEGEDVDLVGMIDTLMPGMQRARRSRIYAEMARRGDVLGMARRIRDVVRWRILLKSTERRGRRAALDGRKLDPAARGAWVTLQVNEIVERHRPAPYEGRVVYFSAGDSHSWRTTDPWQELLDDLEIVPIEGSHAGDAGLMTGARIARIAGEMAQRLV
jgi:amino acid adenylation domain-containing protein